MFWWLTDLEQFANKSPIASWMFALLFAWFFYFALYGTARIISILIVKWMPDGKLRRFLLQRSPD